MKKFHIDLWEQFANLQAYRSTHRNPFFITIFNIQHTFFLFQFVNEWENLITRCYCSTLHISFVITIFKLFRRIILFFYQFFEQEKLVKITRGIFFICHWQTVE